LSIAFSYGTSWSATVWLIVDVHVSLFQVFDPPSDTAGTHAVISIHVTVTHRYLQLSRSSQEIQKLHIDKTIYVRSVTFPATEYNEVLLVCQPG
jgi:hypothetical protein